MSTTLIEQVKADFYRFVDASTVLGINPVTLWRWVKQGKIQTYRIGREVLIEKAEVERLRMERQL